MKKVFLAAVGDGPLMEKVRVYLLMDDTAETLSFQPWDMEDRRKEHGDLRTEVVGLCHGYVIERGPSKDRGRIRLVLGTANDNPLGARDDFRVRDMDKDSAQKNGGRVDFPIPVMLDNRSKATSWRYELAWSRYNG